MPIHYLIDESVLVIKVKAVWSPSEEKQVEKTAMEMMKSNSLQCMLLDLGEADESSELSEMSYIIEATTNLTKHYAVGTRFAVVYSKPKENFVKKLLFESIAASQGVQAKAFDKYSHAKIWLSEV